MPFKLRDYQTKIILEIYNYLRSNQNRLLVQAATGSGKSVIVAKLTADFLKQGRRIAIVAHRAKLLDQLSGTIKAFCNHDSAFIAAGRKTDYDNPVQLCMVQTLTSKKRIMPQVDVVLVDECHVTTYHEGFIKLLKANFGPVWSLSPKILIGLTATPYRLNKREGLCRYFDYIINAPSPRELIKLGNLTHPEVYVHDTDTIDLKTVRIDEATGDYNAKDMAKALNESYVKDVVDKWQSVEPDSKTILFAGSVAQCRMFVKEFKSRGVKSRMLTGSTKVKERQDIYSQFANNEYQVLINVNVLTEGFDQPDIKTVVLARPSKSFALVSQMIGRSLRLHESKPYANIIDCSGFMINYRHMQMVKDTDGNDVVNDFFEQLATRLCPVYRMPGEAPTKMCCNEDCGETIAAPILICPHCHTQQPVKQKDIDMSAFPELVKIDGKDIKQLKKNFKWLRKKLNDAFDNCYHPATAEDDYFFKFKELPEDNYYHSAIMPDDSDLARSVMTYYLSVVTKLNKKAIKKYYELEFGDTRLVKPFSPSAFLQVKGTPESLSLADINKAYFKRASNVSPEYSQILNFAYNEVLRRCGYK